MKDGHRHNRVTIAAGLIALIAMHDAAQAQQVTRTIASTADTAESSGQVGLSTVGTDQSLAGGAQQSSGFDTGPTSSSGKAPSTSSSGLPAAKGGPCDNKATANLDRTPGRDVAGTGCNPTTTGSAGTSPLSSQPTLEQVSYDQATLASNDPLAQAQLGLGRVDGGMDELDLALGPPQVFTDLRTLEDEINVGSRPTANAVARYSTQSDHLDITQEEVSQDIYFSEGRGQVRLGAQALRYTPFQGYGIRQRAAGFTGSYRISDTAAIAGEYWYNWLKAENNQHSTDSTYDLFLTLWPSDVIRIDIDTNGRFFDNVLSLQLGIVARSVGGSVDYMPTNRLRLTVRGRGGFYSDGNRRQSAEVEAVWRVVSQPRIDIGVLGTGFHYDRLLNNGYFNPRSYRSGELMGRLQSDIGKRFTVELAGSGGIENADPGGTKPLVKASLQGRYKLYKNWSVDGQVAHFSSRTSTSSGFSRTSFTAGLHLKF